MNFLVIDVTIDTVTRVIGRRPGVVLKELKFIGHALTLLLKKLMFS